MRELEKYIHRANCDLMERHAESLLRRGVTRFDAAVEVRVRENDKYESEYCIHLFSDDQIVDVLEFHIYRNGEPQVTVNEAVEWLEKQIAEFEIDNASR